MTYLVCSCGEGVGCIDKFPEVLSRFRQRHPHWVEVTKEEYEEMFGATA
jgi:hypothetical protein